MAKRHMKCYSKSLIIKEKQIKTTMRHQFILVRLSSKRQEITSVGEDVKKRERLCSASGNVNWYSHSRKLFVETARNIKNKTTI